MSFPIFGILLHAVGAFAAAICFTPQHKVRNWSYESFWFWMCMGSWLLLPVIGSLLFIPGLTDVLAASPRDAMWKSFGFGAAYGFGGMAFGFAIRHVGYSLTYALAVGLSAVLGFFLTPLVQGKLGEITSSAGGSAVLAGVGIGFAGSSSADWPVAKKKARSQARATRMRAASARASASRSALSPGCFPRFTASLWVRPIRSPSRL